MLAQANDEKSICKLSMKTGKYNTHSIVGHQGARESRNSNREARNGNKAFED
jgi:hypothetical protein